MATVNKSTLIERIADEANASKSEAQKFFDAFTGVVESELKKGNQVQITGFGKFYVQRRDARQGINPQTKQRINIPASKVPKFTAGTPLKDKDNYPATASLRGRGHLGARATFVSASWAAYTTTGYAGARRLC
ncbi:MAG: HU family DNA-binding protein [Rubrobacter sp.]|nr:HU family DNA-binding protein [Rubrobacter sp.]